MPAAGTDGHGISFPQFDNAKVRMVVYHHVGGERKSLFEDKVAVSATGQYQESSKQEWVETTRNYLVSKAFAMSAFLLWAESAQAATITEAHVSGWPTPGSVAITNLNGYREISGAT